MDETDFVGVRCPGVGNSSTREWPRNTCGFWRTPWQADILQSIRSTSGEAWLISCENSTLLWEEALSRGKVVSSDHALPDRATWDTWGLGLDGTGSYRAWNGSVGSLPVCRRVKTVHDYSARILIRMASGEAPAPSHPVCLHFHILATNTQTYST